MGNQSHELRCPFWRSCACSTIFKLFISVRGATFNGLQAVFFALLVMLNTCSAMCCEFCANIRAILRFPRMMELCATTRWAAGKLVVGFLMSDDCAGFKSWVARDMLDALRLKCFQHIGRKSFGSILLLFGSIFLFGSLLDQ